MNSDEAGEACGPDAKSSPVSGRPPVTTRKQLGLIALELMLDNGYDTTSVDDIASAAGVSRRTFFRYFPTKSAVLWLELDDESARLRELLTQAPPELPMMLAIRDAVVAVNRDRGSSGMRELRARMKLITSVPSLQSAATLHYEGWARAVGDFVASRTGVPHQSLFAEAAAQAVLASALAAYDAWTDRPDRALVSYLDEVLSVLAVGFAEPDVRARASAQPFTRRPRRTAIGRTAPMTRAEN